MVDVTYAPPISTVLYSWWHTTVSMADHQCTSATSGHRSSLFSFVLGFTLLTTMTWLYHVLRLRYGPRSFRVAAPQFRTCYHLISRTVMLVANSSSHALRLGCLCKPTDKRRLWELCSGGALQILDLMIDWAVHWPIASFVRSWLIMSQQLISSCFRWSMSLNFWWYTSCGGAPQNWIIHGIQIRWVWWPVLLRFAKASRRFLRPWGLLGLRIWPKLRPQRWCALCTHPKGKVRMASLMVQ